MFTALLMRFSQPSPPAREGMDAGTLTSVTLTFDKPVGFQHGRMIPEESLALAVTTVPEGIFDDLYMLDKLIDGDNEDDTVSIVAVSPLIDVGTTQITASVNVILMEGTSQAHSSAEATASPATLGASDFGMTDLGPIANVTVTVESYADGSPQETYYVRRLNKYMQYERSTPVFNNNPDARTWPEWKAKLQSMTSQANYAQNPYIDSDGRIRSVFFNNVHYVNIGDKYMKYSTGNYLDGYDHYNNSSLRAELAS